MRGARGLLSVLTVVVVIAVGCSSGGDTDSGGAPSVASTTIPGVVFERAAGREHRQGHIDYQGKKPPTGGDHNPVPLTCGFYDQQPPDEFAVHSLEHGAVWIAFDPSLPAADVAKLRAFTQLDHVL